MSDYLEGRPREGGLLLLFINSLSSLQRASIWAKMSLRLVRARGEIELISSILPQNLANLIIFA
jgi:hypothetical protein